jgi:hypothetical protein
MSTEVNYDYHSKDDVLNTHIDNVLMFKKYIDTILNEIKSGDYNTIQIQKLSLVAEGFFNELDDKNTLEYVFNPRTNIVEINSDTSVSDVESDFDSDVHNSVPDFLDNDEKSKKFDYLTRTMLSQNEESYKYKSYHPEQHSHQYKQHTSHPYGYDYMNLSEPIKTTCSAEIVSNSGVLDKNDSLESSDIKMPTDIPKPKDKLVDEFLNNNLELNNYHYLKSFNINRVNNYIEQSNNY